VSCSPKITGQFAAAVDAPSAPHALTRTGPGVSDLSRLRRAACARRSRGPKQVGGSAVRAEVGRTDARCGLRLARRAGGPTQIGGTAVRAEACRTAART